MCLGLKGFVLSPLPSAAAAVASAPKRSRIRTTAYVPITTTTTRSSGIHTLLNSRNTLCLLTLPVVAPYRTPSPTRRHLDRGRRGGPNPRRNASSTYGGYRISLPEPKSDTSGG